MNKKKMIFSDKLSYTVPGVDKTVSTVNRDINEAQYLNPDPDPDPDPSDFCCSVFSVLNTVRSAKK